MVPAEGGCEHLRARALGAVERSLLALLRSLVRLDVRLSAPSSTTRATGLDHSGALTLVLLELRGPLRPGQLAQLCGLSTGGVSLLLDRLESAGLVRRSRGAVPHDRRAVVTTITDPGCEVLSLVDAAVLQDASELEGVLIDLRRYAGPEAPARPRPPSASPVLGAMLSVIGAFDLAAAPLLRGHEGLEISDPRPFLVLLRARLGVLTLAEVPELVGRTRNTSHRLLRRMEAWGLVERDLPSAGGRAVSVRLTSPGQDLTAALVRAAAAVLPGLGPAIDDLLQALRVGRAAASSIEPMPAGTTTVCGTLYADRPAR